MTSFLCISINMKMIQNMACRCQHAFIDNVIERGRQRTIIAKNKALRENVFMMIVCIENRIALFVIGKPGSSKSLAKTLVVDAMKGSSSNNDLLRSMKSVSFMFNLAAKVVFRIFYIFGMHLQPYKISQTHLKVWSSDWLSSVVIVTTVLQSLRCSRLTGCFCCMDAFKK